MSQADLRDEARGWETHIDLRQFLVAHGWTLGKPGERQGAHATNWYLHRAGALLSVKKKDGVWVWIDEHTKIGGTILRYPALYEGCERGRECCNLIRLWLANGTTSSGVSVAPNSQDSPLPEVTAADRDQEIDWDWHTFPRIFDYSYTRRRGLSDDVVLANSHLIRQCAYGALRNVAFGFVAMPARIEEHGLVSSYERRWFDSAGRSCKSFPAGCSKKGIWLSHAPEPGSDFGVIVIAESAIDALSFQQLFALPDALLLAFGGNMTGGAGGPQHRAIVTIAERFPRSRVLLAVDRDGEKFVRQIQSSVMRAIPAVPRAVKDWNMVLQQELGWAKTF
jgi:hypothetical protein